MHRAMTAGAVIAGSAAVLLLSGASALAQMQSFPNGIDCSKLPPLQQNDCRVQQQDNASSPWAPTPLPGSNGQGTNQDGRIMPYGSGQTNGSSSGAGGGNGGASPPGQSSN